MKVELSRKQFEYLKLNLSKEKIHLAKYLNNNLVDDKAFVEIPDDISDEIRDWAGEKLQKVGFDINYDLTEEGVILEELIDLFYI